MHSKFQYQDGVYSLGSIYYLLIGSQLTFIASGSERILLPFPEHVPVPAKRHTLFIGPSSSTSFPVNPACPPFHTLQPQ